MGDLSDKFNFSAPDNLENIVERRKEYLGTDQRGIFEDFRKGLDQDTITLAKRQEAERVGRITKEANFVNGSPHLEFGTQRLSKPIHEIEVVAMMKRADQEAMPLDQLTPHSVRDLYIQQGYAKTIKREQVQMDDLGRQNLAASNKLLDNLLDLDAKSHDGPQHGLGQEREPDSISETFDRAAGRDL
jgi:hypothetical protein